MWLNYPLLGLGPDNFRHVYGSYLGQAEFDDRITANNWYVEMLATVGLIGLIAGFFIVATIVIVMRRQSRSSFPLTLRFATLACQATKPCLDVAKMEAEH